jgi:hypothetical protein
VNHSPTAQGYFYSNLRAGLRNHAQKGYFQGGGGGVPYPSAERKNSVFGFTRIIRISRVWGGGVGYSVGTGAASDFSVEFSG